MAVLHEAIKIFVSAVISVLVPYVATRSNGRPSLLTNASQRQVLTPRGCEPWLMSAFACKFMANADH